MSTLESKLEQPRTTSGKARATLAQLMKRWGSPTELDGKSAPEMILVTVMTGGVEYWKPVARDKDPKATVYELVETLKEER